MSTLAQLATPLRYLRIAGTGKRLIDLWLPVVLGVGSTLLLLWIKAPLVSTGGLVERVNELLQVLVGFYVASLAAVSTFDGLALDQNVRNAKLKDKEITRRSLLSFLFAYLALCSLALYCLGVFAMIAPAALAYVATFAFAKELVVFAYTVVCWNLIVVTLLGLHYLADRINRPEPVVHTQPGEGKDAPSDVASPH